MGRDESHVSLPPGFPCVAPDQFRLDGFDERLTSGVIITIARVADQSFEPMSAQDLLIIVGAILAARNVARSLLAVNGMHSSSPLLHIMLSKERRQTAASPQTKRYDATCP